MKKYKIIIDPKAELDLDGIYNYISETFFAPDTASEQTDRILRKLTLA